MDVLHWSPTVPLFGAWIGVAFLVGCLKRSPVGANRSNAFVVIFSIHPKPCIKYQIIFVFWYPKNIRSNWLFWLDDCKSLHPFWSLQLSYTGLFLYDNAVVSPFRPMGGELSFYLDLPSWELTYPLRMRFWVDDFPNFPRWDMWSFLWIGGIMCTFDRILTPDKSEHNSEFTD